MGLRPITYNLNMDLIANSFQKSSMEDINGNNKLMAIRSEMATERAKRTQVRNTGFIAQEVEVLAKSLGYEFSGVDIPQNEESSYGLRYAEFVVPLVKAMQEQQEIIEEMRKEINELKQLR